MEKIKLHVSGSRIEVAEQLGVITAGTVGLEAEFVFDSQWDRLSKTVVFRAGDKVIASALRQDTITVPWEVLEKSNLWLAIGVYGAKAGGDVVIPTIWANVAVIHAGVEPEGDPALDPTIPAWQDALARLDDIGPELRGHITNAGGGNPHGVTCEEIGAASSYEVDTLMYTTAEAIGQLDLQVSTIIELAESADYHSLLKDNPHDVTCEQIGAVAKQEFDDEMSRLPDKMDLAASNALDTMIANREILTDQDFDLFFNDAVESWSTFSGVREHVETTNGNPHSITPDMIGAATKEEVSALGAVIVTVEGTTPSHTSQEIFDLIRAGKVVYLELWGNTYTICSCCTAGEAKFENSYVTVITDADGKGYSAQNFRLFLIKGSTYGTNTVTIPSQAYVDAQIAALNQ